MNATELFLKDGKSAEIYFCGKCRCVARSQHLAEQCCQNYKCSQCGVDTGGRSWLICDACRDKQEAAKEAERFEKAQKLTEWAGWVYSDGQFFESVEYMRDVLGSDHTPQYAWACEENHFVNADVSDITERMDDAYEDFDPESLNGLEELRAALDRFNQANVGQISYTPDYSKAVLL